MHCRARAEHFRTIFFSYICLLGRYVRYSKNVRFTKKNAKLRSALKKYQEYYFRDSTHRRCDTAHEIFTISWIVVFFIYRISNLYRTLNVFERTAERTYRAFLLKSNERTEKFELNDLPQPFHLFCLGNGNWRRTSAFRRELVTFLYK